ncbi:MAG: hypothetical protein JWN67_416 [Actinomycetia bacterium]|nr:hypothetical protein [Actinomycetes bacterium]
MSPPNRSTTTRTAARRGAGEKAVRRDVIIQCRRCKCQGTGRITAAGLLTTVSVAAYREAGVWWHNRCGGTFAGFDTAVRR